jgi:predicted metal-binding protein
VTTVPSLHVCVTCRAGLPLAEGATPPGAQLHDAVARLLPADAAAPLLLRPVVCLASCSRGCTAAIAMPGKWTYLLGGLHADMAADLLSYGAAYAASVNGTLMPSRRPASLRDAVLARFPAFDLSETA